MTTETVPAGGEPRRLLSDVHSLARQVRRDQRATWIALSILAGATFVAIPFDYFFLVAHCTPVGDGAACTFDRRGFLYYWPPALLLSYAAIALCYVRIARRRGLGARVLPYAITGAALTVLFTAAWVGIRLYLAHHGTPANPLPSWALLLDRLVAPAGTIGVALLVLARLERNVPLLVFTLGYLAVVLVPIDFGWGRNWGIHTTFLPPQIIAGTVLLGGAVGFALAHRRPR
ncbi:hypothetical protein ODJ79_20445 [Actinoplanes sp. KI2]|uniref:hypothetical protein n=1 Tax=Actinoplanes sp. KI2 TaxID=2983315 RepID=UPI0021D5E3C6|nr:hypothetical protein [Actinoplanes sp. KI2]MCU7726102.1 hypothetical protein [Actinoplanes sp. KI2]